MVSTIRYSANASSAHHPNQVPGILIIMNPKQPNLPTCSVTSTYLLFHLLSNPSLHLIANTTLGIIMTAIKISPKTLNHSILSTITNFDLSLCFLVRKKQVTLFILPSLRFQNQSGCSYRHSADKQCLSSRTDSAAPSESL